ncbi:MAG TPA: putative ABC exporter domain-containing protein [Gemmatimonadaceae bacterium]|nr:putative ABC exporter domain-containing protein [Gemmatimonadaceae bacterium]
MAAGALRYLTWTSVRNRIAQRLRQTRNPRYALALAIGVAYFYFVFWRNPRHSGRGEVFPLLTAGGHLFALCALFLGAVSMWAFGGDSAALAFTPAEASFLFPAPVSRRELVGYKLLRGQLPLLFNTLIWLLILDSGRSTLPVWARGIGLWLLFSTIFLHRVGASLVRTAWAEHGAAGARRNAVSLALFVVVVAGVGATLVRAVPLLRAAADLDARVAVLGVALSQAPARWVLWPFSALLAPVFAISVSEWLAALPGVAAVLAAHVWWVMRTDTAFEEAALAASAARARKLEALRGRAAPRAGGVPNAAARRPARAGGRFGLRLRATGRPAVAIVWKNLACLRRTAQQRQLITPTLMAVIVGVTTAPKVGALGGVAAGLLAFAGSTLVFGPMALRGDLRQDLQHIAELKTLPFTGTTIVAAEVLSMAIPLAAVQAAALLGAAVAAQAGGMAWAPAAVRAAIAIGALPALLAVNACTVTIQNGAPILFPGWARLGAVVPGGVEMMGQMILVTVFHLLLLVLLLVLPVAMGAVVAGTLGITGGVGLAAGIMAGSAGMALELQGVMQLLGRAFDRLEPSSVSG